MESTSDDGNTGTPSFRDIDDTRDGYQVVVNLDYSAFGLAADTFDSYVKYVSIEDFVAYKEWHASLPDDLKLENIYYDNSGTEITAPGYYDFYRYNDSMDGAKFITNNGLIQSIEITLTDNKFGDFDLEHGADYLTGDGRIYDPGVAIRKPQIAKSDNLIEEPSTPTQEPESQTIALSENTQVEAKIIRISSIKNNIEPNQEASDPAFNYSKN